MKSSKNCLVYFTGFRCCRSRELQLEIKNYTLTPYFALGIWSERNTRKMENQRLVLPTRQCSCTPVVLIKDFLAKNNVTTLKHPKHSHNLAAADFCLLPRMKSALKGRCLRNVIDALKNATEELKRLS